MSKRYRREETPEPEDESRKQVKEGSSAGAWWDIQGQLEAIRQLKINFNLLMRDGARKRFPEFPELHDQAWLNFSAKIKRAVLTVESLFEDLDSNGWLSVQASPSGQGYMLGARTQLWDMEGFYEHVIGVLESVVTLQVQILAGRHKKPYGAKRLKELDSIPHSYRPEPDRIPEPWTDYHDSSENLVDPDYDLTKRAEQLGEAAADIERYRVILRPNIVALEEMKSRQEQNDNHPALVPAEHIPLEEISEKKGQYIPLGPSIKSLKCFMEEIDACRQSGRPPVREPSPEIEKFLSPGTYSTPTKRKPAVKVDDSGWLPSIYKTFRDEEFMRTSFTDQAQTWKMLPHPPVERKFDTCVIEDGHDAVKPFLMKAMTTSDYRIATHHIEETGEIHVSEYFHNQTRYYLAQNFWNSF